MHGNEQVALRDRIGCSVREACTATGLRPTTMYGLLADGTIESRKVGKRRIVLVRSLLRLIEGDSAAKNGAEAEAA